MKKFTIVVLLYLGTIYGASAQYYSLPHNSSNSSGTGVKLGVGLSSGFAVGAVSNSFPETGGFSVKAEFPVGKSPLSVLLSTGYTFYVSDSGYGVEYDTYGGFGFSSYGSGYIASFIPVEAGLKLYIAKRFFIEGDAGVSFNVNTYTSDYTGKTTAFIYSPAAGYSFPLGYSDRNKLDLSLLYESRPEYGGGYNQIAIRGVFNFSL
jgi:hypothetical protein